MNFDLIRDQIQKIAGSSHYSPVEFFDVRATDARGLRIQVAKGVTREIATSHTRGVGIRVLCDSGWGFSSTNQTDAESLERTFRTAYKLARAAGEHARQKFTLSDRDPLAETYRVSCKVEVETVPVEEKVQFVLDQDARALEVDDHIVNSKHWYTDAAGDLAYFDSFGRNLRKHRSVVRYSAFLFAQEGGVLQQGSESLGIVGGYEALQTEDAAGIAERAAREAVSMLAAKPLPGGKSTVLIDPKLCGTFIHEAFGHACEADTVLAKNSVLEGRMGETIGSELVNIVDDATLADCYGYYTYDSEGTLGSRTVLVERGQLASYMHTLETASRMGVDPTGNGRAQGYSSIPQARMSNTVLLPGDMTFDELLESVGTGVYAQDWRYGYTNPGNGQFMFKVKKAQLIENGEVQDVYYRDAAMSGMILTVFKNVKGLGKETKYADGTCGKGGQGVPVGDGGVHTVVDNVIIGGQGQ